MNFYEEGWIGVGIKEHRWNKNCDSISIFLHHQILTKVFSTDRTVKKTANLKI